MSKKIIAYLGSLFVLTFIFLTPLSLQAALVDTDTPDPNPQGICNSKYDCGNYDVNDMLMLAITAANWILGIVGSLTLLMFIYGGFLFLVSSGSSEQITKAKGVLIAAVIGLAIVFSSYLIIKFVLSSVGIEWDGNVNKITQQNHSLYIS